MAINISTTGVADADEKMTLTLHRFRRVESLSVAFPVSGVMLLDGKSGVGKTTLLDAIQFVFYDNLGNSCYDRALRSVAGKKPPTWVSIDMPDGTFVKRQRRPNTLVYRDDHGELHDAAAQGAIDERFGDYVTWRAGCMIRQEQPCGFFVMSSKEKLSLFQNYMLSSRVNGTRQFDTLIGKTASLLDDATKQLTYTTHRVESTTEMVNDHRVDMDGAWSDERQQALLAEYDVTTLSALAGAVTAKGRDTVARLQSRLDTAKDARTRNREIERQHRELSTAIDDHARALESCRYHSDEKVHGMEADIRRDNARLVAAKQTNARQQLESTRHELSNRLGDLSLPSTIYTEMQLDDIERALAGADATSLSFNLEQITASIEYVTRLPSHEKLVSIERELSSCPDESSQDEIDRLNRMIWLSNKSLECPVCESPLVMSDKRLTRVDDAPRESAKQLGAALTQRKEDERAYQKRLRLEPERDALRAELSRFHVDRRPPYADTSLDRLETLKRETSASLERRLRVPESIDVDLERRKLAQHAEREMVQAHVREIDRELETLETSGGTEAVDVSNLVKEINRKTETLATWRDENREYQRVESLLSHVRSQRDKLPAIQATHEPVDDLASAIDQSEREREDMVARVHAQEQQNRYAAYQRDLARYQKERDALTRRVGALETIKKTLVTAEYVMLDTFTQEINHRLAEIVPSLFHDPVSVVVRSIKRLKTDERISPKISVEIGMDNAECSSIHDVSGGERSRISLALAIVLSRFNGLPFLLLDESLASLDADIKERVTRTIRAHVDDKLVIAVNHDTTTGAYDFVAQLS